jgi:hypothetical protein
MGLFDIFRPKVILPEIQELEEDASMEGVMDEINYGSLKAGEKKIVGEILNKIRTDVSDRHNRFKEYRRMSKDVILAQAIEMMADDTIQFDVERGKVLWIESPDKKFAKKINWIIDTYIMPFIHDVAEYILKYGEYGFKIVEIEDGGEHDIKWALVPIIKVEKLYHFIMPDQTHYAVMTDKLKKNYIDVKDKTKLLEDTDFVHFIKTSLENSTEVKVSLGKDKEETAILLNGASVLTDKVVEIYRILTALEEAIIISRLDKSKSIRFFNVDVTGISNKKANEIVNYIDGALNKNETMSSTTDSYTATRIQAESVNVVLPVKQDKGKVTIEEYTPQADFKEIVDVDHFYNKFLSGIRVPKPYLVMDESMPGVGQSGSLMRMDIRYARAVKKVQKVLVDGIENLVETYIKRENIEKAPKYDIKVVKVSTPEDEEKNFELESRITTANTTIDSFLLDESGSYNIDKMDNMIKFFTQVIPIAELVTYLQDIRDNIKIEAEPNEEDQ